MLTLGLEEGIFLSVCGFLAFVALLAGGAPMHRILGPPVLAVVGVAAYMLHAEGAFGNAVSILSFGVFGFLGFFLPLGVLRYGWRALKEPKTRRVTEPKAEPKPEARAENGTRPLAKIGTISVPAATPGTEPAGPAQRRRETAAAR